MNRRTLAALAALALTGLLAGCGEPDAPPRAGFAGLGAASDAFTPARPGRALRFPADHGAHPDYRIEWWYLTANLEDAQGTPLGVQWTLFRQALPPATAPGADSAAPGPWAAEQLWMAHLAVSQGATHRVAERFARSATASAPDAQAGVHAAPFRAWLDDWRLINQSESGEDTFRRLVLTATAEGPAGDFGVALTLNAEGPLVRHGVDGFSQKAASGQGSHYYSQPFWRVTGTLRLDGETRAVQGQAWLDREWSSQLLDARQQGWDWFALHLSDGHKLMAFQLRGGGDPSQGDSAYRAGSWIAPDGRLTPLAPDALRLTPLVHAQVAGRELPVRWRLEVPGQGLDLTVAAPHPERWMPTRVPYWEGAVTVSDTASGAARGRGYLEMTGY